MTAGGDAAETKVWIDGEIVEVGRARISVLDHGLLYGDGIFEGIRARNRKVFRLDDHLARLLELAPSLDLRPAERTLSRVDLLRADEVFITGTGAGVPVRSLDGQPVGGGAPGPVASRVRVAYTDFARSTGAPF